MACSELCRRRQNTASGPRTEQQIDRRKDWISIANRASPSTSELLPPRTQFNAQPSRRLSSRILSVGLEISPPGRRNSHTCPSLSSFCCPAVLRRALSTRLSVRRRRTGRFCHSSRTFGVNLPRCCRIHAEAGESAARSQTSVIDLPVTSRTGQHFGVQHELAAWRAGGGLTQISAQCRGAETGLPGWACMLPSSVEEIAAATRSRCQCGAYAVALLPSVMAGVAFQPPGCWARASRRISPCGKDTSETDGMFPRTDFTYDAERDVYVCPNGRPLRTSGTVHDGRVRELPVTIRRLPRLQAQGAMHARRGLSGARDEFHLAGIVQNLKTFANHVWRPPPDVRAASMA
jgi:hypothetical protein